MSPNGHDSWTLVLFLSLTLAACSGPADSDSDPQTGEPDPLVMEVVKHGPALFRAGDFEGRELTGVVLRILPAARTTVRLGSQFVSAELSDGSPAGYVALAPLHYHFVTIDRGSLTMIGGSADLLEIGGILIDVPTRHAIRIDAETEFTILFEGESPRAQIALVFDSGGDTLARLMIDGQSVVLP